MRSFESFKFVILVGCGFAGLLLAVCVLLSTVVELGSMRHLSKVVIDLCNELSPERPPVSIDSYNYFMVCRFSPSLSVCTFWVERVEHIEVHVCYFY